MSFTQILILVRSRFEIAVTVAFQAGLIWRRASAPMARSGALPMANFGAEPVGR